MPPDDVIDTVQSDNTQEKSVLDLIMSEPPKKEKETPERKAPERAPEGDDNRKDDEQDEPSDDEGEDSSEDPDGEKESEDEEVDAKAEGEEDTSDEDDIDEYLVDVVVDGQKQEVKLKDLKKSYSGTRFIEANVQKAVEARKVVETQASTLFEVNKAAKVKLENLDRILKLHAEPAIDWETLRKNDVNAYLLKREEVRDIQAKQAQVSREVERIDAEQADIQAHAMQQYLEDQSQILVTKLPDLSDAKKASVLMASLEEGANKHYGYTKQEFQGIVDHRAMLILHDAVEFRKLREASKKTREKLNEDTSERKVLIRPGSRKSSQTSATKRLDQENIKRARESGKPDDVAATLLIRKKG